MSQSFRTPLQLSSQEEGCSGCSCEGPVPIQTFITYTPFVISCPQGPAKPIRQAQCLPCQSPPSHIGGNAQAPNLRSFIPTPMESLEEWKPLAFTGLGFQPNQYSPVEQLQAKQTHPQDPQHTSLAICSNFNVFAYNLINEGFSTKLLL